jgi:hypothetical protein
LKEEGFDFKELLDSNSIGGWEFQKSLPNYDNSIIGESKIYDSE